MKKINYIIVILLLFAEATYSQGEYKVIRTRLPMSAVEKDYYVKKIGVNYVLNGDIIVGNAGQSLMIYQSNNSDGAYIWPKGYVPVKIDRSMYEKTGLYGKSLYQNSIDAIEELNAKTNIRLIPYSGQKDYIRIMYTPDTGYGGVSPLGRKGGEQIMYITRESDAGVVIHELLHSLGFWHEQSRFDRDNYVVIDTNNAIPGTRHNFQIEPGTPSSPYDYESIMHYPAYAFAIDKTKPTIQCRKNNVISNCISQYLASRLSESDISGINTTYWFNKDVPKRSYSAELPYDENMPKIRKVQPKATEANQKQSRIIDKPLADAIYMIKLQGTGKYLDITGVSNENGALLQQWEKAGGDNQRFAVTSIGNGLYLLKAMHSGKYLNVVGQSVEFRAGICQWDYVDQDNLKFYITYNSAQGGYNIKGLQSGMSWTVLRSENGAQVVQDSQIAEAFTFEKVANMPSVVQTDDRLKKPILIRKDGIPKKQ